MNSLAERNMTKSGQKHVNTDHTMAVGQRGELNSGMVTGIRRLNALVLPEIVALLARAKAALLSQEALPDVETISDATAKELLSAKPPALEALSSLSAPIITFSDQVAQQVKYAPVDRRRSPTGFELPPAIVCHALCQFVEIYKSSPTLAPLLLRIPAAALKELGEFSFADYYAAAPYVPVRWNVPEGALVHAMKADPVERFGAVARMMQFRAGLQ